MNMAPNIVAWTLGGPEIFLIFLVVLLLFGAKKLPELARGLGSSVKEFKKAKDEFDDELRRTNEDLRVEEPAGRVLNRSNSPAPRPVPETSPHGQTLPAENPVPSPADTPRV